MDLSPPRGFETSEFQDRTRRAQQAMEAQGCAALLVMTEPEVRYFSGFQTLFWQSPTRPWFLIIPASGAPIAVIPEIGADLMRRTWITDIRTWAAPAPEDDGVSLLAEALKPLAQSRERLGVMMGHETHLRMPLGDWQRLLARLPGLRLEDTTKCIQGLRMVKSPAEQDKLRHICSIGSHSFARVPEILAEGMPLDAAFRSFRREGLAQGADDVPYLVGGAETGGYSDVISPPTARPLSRGDVLMLDTGMVWDGYFCDFDRNWSIGPPSAEVQHVHHALWEATDAGIAAARPGKTARDVFQAIANVLTKAGATGNDIGRMGHGLGMQLTEQPSLAAFDDTELSENMVLTIEPSLSYGAGQMMVHEENLIVTANGPERLSTRAPLDIPVI